MQKYEIVNGFAPPGGNGRYLELCTPSTGVKFALVDPDRYAVRHRLMYRCPETFEDGQKITFRTTACGSQDLVRAVDALLLAEQRYDVILVDPWHSYAASAADLHGALCLLRPGGVLVVHDCNPTDPELVSPEFRAGGWCGVTYQAFIDFVLSAEPAGHCVVDSDYGCGVVFTQGCAVPEGLRTVRPGRRLVFEWAIAREDDAARFAFFSRNRQALLNMVEPFDFADAMGFPLPEPAPATGVADLSDPPAAADGKLSVVVDGQAVALDGYAAGWHRFLLPAGVSEVRLVSPAMVPGEVNPHSQDMRRLGLAVAAIRLDGRSIDLGSPALSRGWHSEEAQAGYPFRWTDGDARLRLPAGVGVLEVFTTNRVGG